MNDESAKWAAAGDSVLVSLTGLDILQIRCVFIFNVFFLLQMTMLLIVNILMIFLY